MNYFKDAEKISLEEMLDAKEKRVLRQEKMLKQYGQPLISFSLNIPGPYKEFPFAEKVFYIGDCVLETLLQSRDIQMDSRLVISGKFGSEGLYSVRSDAETIKKLTIRIEEEHPLGRLFDYDVLDVSGRKLSRIELGGPERCCMICGEPGAFCSRSRKHSVPELQTKIVSIMRSYFDVQVCRNISCLAQRALLYELSATPKPGLVDRANSGSHSDMDYYTFLDSIAILAPFFHSSAMAGIVHAGHPKEMFLELRRAGLEAEKNMYLATQGINTHKGAIFAFGLLCASAAWDYNDNGLLPDVSRILEKLRVLGKIAFLKRQNNEYQKTHGEKIYYKYGIEGALGEAANGYRIVEKYGVPLLRDTIEKTRDKNLASVVVLLRFLAEVNDTNIISRAGINTFLEIQEQIKKDIYKKNVAEDALAYAKSLDEDFIKKNISAGGCADLLGISWFLYFLCESDYPGPYGWTDQ